MTVTVADAPEGSSLSATVSVGIPACLPYREVVWDPDSRSYSVYSEPPSSGDRFQDGYIEACREILRDVCDSRSYTAVKDAVTRGLEQFGIRDVEVDGHGKLSFIR